MYYKTPELKELLFWIISQNPSHKEDLLQLESELSKIDLSLHIRDGETFRQTINLNSGGQIELTWNVDDVIHYAKSISSCGRFLNCDLLSIYHNPEFGLKNKDAAKTLKNVQKSKLKSKIYVHKLPYIILARLPYTNGFCIIDGNHRFFEALVDGKNRILALTILDDECIPFLQPESQKYISFCRKVEQILQA